MMTRATRSACCVVAYGVAAAVCDCVACAAVSLQSFLNVPAWVAFLPCAVAWIAAGVRGISPEGLIGVGAISLVGGPILAARVVSLPMQPGEAMAVAFNSIRQGLTTSLVIMLPLCLVGVISGVMIRGGMEGGLIHLPWVFPRR